MKLRLLSLTACLLSCMMAVAQINGYAQVTALSGSICTIGAAQESFAQFSVGKHVVIMQMQDNVIGENTFNTSTFGDLGSIANAGAYAIRKITAIERTAGVLTSVTLDPPPGITFNFNVNANVQLITYELLGGGGDHTTTGNIGAMVWNGTLGGVVAFYVEGTLYLQHNIVADNAGFRGGARTISGEGSCDESTYVYDSQGYRV